MKFAAYLSIALLTVTATPVLAQTPIKAGEAVSGTLTATSEVANGTIHDCYVLDTTPGSKWVVEMSGGFDTYLQLGRGATCQEATWDRRNDDVNTLFGNLSSRIKFNAGGGGYLIMARALGGGAAGAYTLTVTQEAGVATRGMLPAGQSVAAMRPAVGTASTVSGPQPQEQPGQMLQDCATCPEVVVIQPGSFMMGSPATENGRAGAEGPRHLVTVGRAFAIGKYEVTFDEYDACVADKGCRQVADNGFGRGRRPVVNVTFADAQRYVAWLSKATGQQYFLPSEAEWEYAARAGSDTPWNTGSAILSDDANIMDQFQKTVVVGGYPSNAWGLYDTHGNVAEWVQDCMDTGYVGAPTDGSAALEGNCQAQRVYRDNAWNATPAQVRSAARQFAASNAAYRGIGFRVTRALGTDGL